MSSLLALQHSQIAGGMRPAERRPRAVSAVSPALLVTLAVLAILAAGLFGAGTIRSLMTPDVQAQSPVLGPTMRFAKVVVLVRPAETNADLPSIAAQLGVPTAALDPAFGIVRMVDDPGVSAVLMSTDLAQQLGQSPS